MDLPRLARRVWVLDFMEERFPPGAYKGTLIEAGDGKQGGA